MFGDSHRYTYGTYICNMCTNADAIIHPYTHMRRPHLTMTSLNFPFHIEPITHGARAVEWNNENRAFHKASAPTRRTGPLSLSAVYVFRG